MRQAKVSSKVRAVVMATVTLAASAVVLSAGVQGAGADSTTPPPWDTFSPTDGAVYANYTSPAGYGAVGGVLFYNAAGQQITGGSITSGPIAAYAEGTASTGGLKVQLAIALPAASDPAGWNDYPESNASSSFPITTGAPSNLEHVTTGPVYTGSASDQSLSSFLTEYTDGGDPDPGYYQVRLYTFGSGANGTEFNAADIYVDTTNDTWTLAYSYDAYGGGTTSVPTPVGNSVNLTTTAGTKGQAGTKVPLTATVTDADGSTPAGGTVQFFANGIGFGTPITVTGDTAGATYTTTTADEPSDSFTAKFTPASGTNYANSTSNTLVFDVTAPSGGTVTVTPDTGLTTHQTVTVSGKKLAKSQAVDIVECTTANETTTGCDTAGQVAATTSSAGALAKTKLKTAETYKSTAGAVNCAKTSCTVVVANATTHAVLGAAPISFG
jgi:hypothetical protein